MKKIIKVSKRGKDSCTKYLLVPKEARKKMDDEKEIVVDTIETPDHYVVTYTIEKQSQFQSIKIEARKLRHCSECKSKFIAKKDETICSICSNLGE